jgi:tetratricopeptide (TPR) repeat protein
MKQIICILTILIFFSCGRIENKRSDNKVDIKAKELNDKGVELAMSFQNDSIKRAIELFNQAIDLQPDFYLAYWNKFVFQNQLGQKSEAFETLKKLETLKPNNPELLVTTGIFIELRGDSSTARQKFLKADQIYTSIIDTLSQKTVTYQMTLTSKAVNMKFLGQEDEANKIFENVISQNSNSNLKEMSEKLKTMTRKELMENFNSTR